MLALTAVLVSSHVLAPGVLHATRVPHGLPLRAATAHASLKSDFDALLRASPGEAAAALLSDESLELTPAQTSALLDAACDAASVSSVPPPPDGDGGAAADSERQEGLKAVYAALSKRGVLRGFGSISSTELLPLPPYLREITTEEQLQLTGLPTTAFAPARGGSRADLLLGAASAAVLSLISLQLDLDLRVLLAATGVLFLADRIALSGAVAESAVRAVKPGYATTVREHEAGHFLVAYLLGLPIEACLLDVWAAAKDGRFNGAAGTVFVDPELGRAMRTGRVTRGLIDRYSVVVMGGIAAEACQYGRAEGGQADESALIQLLTSLDGGKSYDLGRVRNQARWAASQALLTLREHGAAYKRLCEALERGESVGGCVLAIEAGLLEAFGRNGELPAETRSRQRELAAETRSRPLGAQQGPVAMAADSAPAPARAPADTVAPGAGRGVATPPIGERQEEITRRLDEIKRQLAREEDTWTEQR